MDIAVTGSTGFIGRALSASLTADGHTVVPVVRRAVADGERAVHWDPATGTIDAAALEGIDAVVHLAGESIGSHRWNDEQRRRILESRTKGTALLARTLAALDRKPSVLVSGSAVGYYGDGGDSVLTEASPPGDIFLADVCVQWEAAAAPAADAGIRVPFARTGVVLGRDSDALKPLLSLFRWGLGGKLGSGKQWWSWISIDDEVRALTWLLDHDVSGPVNLTAPEPVTNAELTRALAKAMHRPAFLPVPAFGPRLLKGRELADQLLFLSQRVEPTVLLEHGFEFRHRTIDAAFEHILGT